MNEKIILGWDFSITGIVYIPLTFVLIYIAYRYNRIWKSTGKVFYRSNFHLFIVLALISATGVFAGSIFAHSIQGIRLMLEMSAVFLTLANALMLRIFLTEIDLKIRPNFGFFFIILLGTILTILTVTEEYSPYLEKSGGVNWGLPYYLYISRTVIYYLGICPYLFLMILNYRRSHDVSEKKNYLMQAILFTIFLMIVNVDFLIEPMFHLEALTSEITILIASILGIAAYTIVNELTLSEIERQYRVLIQNLQNVILIVDSDGAIKFTNKNFTALLGYQYVEVLDRSLFDLIAAADKNNVAQHFDLAKRGSESANFEFRMMNSQGETLWMESTGNFIPVAQFSKTYHAFLFACHDVTDRKSAEQNLIFAKEKAESSDKLKSEFLAQISHEIRTPINNVLNYIDVLKSIIPPNTVEGIDQYFKLIDKANHRLVRTVESILDMSELNTGSFTPVKGKIDVYESIISKIVLEYKSAARNKNVSIRIEKDETPTLVIADSYSIEKVFSNLIDNAVKYTEEGEIVISFEENNGDLIVSISDTGIGIAEEFMPYLFQPFRQEEQGYTRSFEGNGIGLTIAKSYCEFNNGELTIESKKNVGTTARVTLKKAV